MEFLNEQMDPAEVLAIELRQFTGEGLRTLVPMVFGQTQESAKKRASSPGARWTEQRFMEAIDAKFGEPEAIVVRALMTWLKQTGLPLIYGTGRENGSVYPLLKPQGVAINPAYLSTEGKIWLQLKPLIGKPVFGAVEKRRALLGKFAEVDGSQMSDSDVDGYPSLSYATIAADPQGKEKVLAAFAWMLEQLNGTAQAGNP